MPDPREQFAPLYQAHYENILRYAARRVGPEGAHDVAAETFLVAWRRRDRVPKATGEALPWLYGVARQVVANEQRGRRRQERLQERLRHVGRREVITQDHLPHLAENSQILQAMRRLSPRDQEALRLIGWEELEIQDAALVVGCSARTFSVRLHRARRRLAAALHAIDDTDETHETHETRRARADKSVALEGSN